MTKEEAWRSAKGYLYDALSGEEADEIIKALEQEPTDTWSIKNVADTLARHGLIVEQEPYEDAISRQAVLDEINRVGVKGFETYNDYSQLFDFVDTLPPVKPQEKTGYWRPIYQGDEIIGYRCSECEFGRTNSIYRANFCPNCGAKMVEKQESEE